MNTVAQSQQNINIVPQRVASDHYQVASFTDQSKIYDITFNYEKKMWVCNCPNAVIKHNNNCKHVILLKSYIHKKKQEQAPEAIQQHSTSAELVQVLSRIAHLEQEQSTRDTLLEQQQSLHEVKADQIAMMQTSLAAAQDTIKQQQYTLERQAQEIERLIDMIMSLQTSVCRLNELTIKQDIQLKGSLEQAESHHQKLLEQQEQIQIWELMLKRVQRETEDMLKAQGEVIVRTTDDQAQQIDALHEQISSQQKANEQVVRIVVEQVAAQPRQARPERQPEEDTAVKQISKSECKVGKFTVGVVGNCAACCDCSIGIMDKQCGHMVKVDQFLSK